LPERTCIGCRRRAASRDLVRFVRVDDAVVVDRSGRASGRGAWLCRRVGCLDAAFDRRSFPRALRWPVTVDAVTVRRDFVELIGEQSSGERPGV
jgi:predicted RNA-binding protein YlxR (DUF448 family)